MSDDLHVPAPAVMPVDREAWRRDLNLSNFVNSYYQLRDVRGCDGARRVLVIGPGQGLDTAVLRWVGYEVTTFDIDSTFEPDVVGSVHDLSMFGDGQFDVVTASHVLEHMAIPYFDRALAELARVARYAIVYLPIHGRQVQLRLVPGVRNLDFSFVFDIFNWFRKPDGMTPQFMAGQHFWEVGLRGFRLRDVRRRLSKEFEIVKGYRNRDWPISQNFVLKSRRHAR